ncbi:uncharacterized protein LOC127285590 [Leptopilina boulardi]|uniref:uncharacterized protein LOC127285590 n=1 Tax=Leptopilina boulardi TaxID=63433 RepID=UPI0021F67F62|nr:uncharacterized protein LOC127285590 [Leptopilina boulardi]
MATISELKKLRGSIKRNLTNFENVLKEINDETDLESLDLDGRLQRHLSLWDAFSNVQDKIDNLITDETERATNDSERESFEKRFYTVSGLTKRHLRTISMTSLASVPQNTVPVSTENVDISQFPKSRFELPKLQTPTFEGSCETWLTFRDAFKSMCHNNPSIPELHKFYYLKACLKSEAAEVIDSLEITAENYKVAWDALNQRYDNQRVIVDSHVKSLFEISCNLKNSSIRGLLDNLQKRMRALDALLTPNAQRDIMLIYLVKSNLNNHNREKWEESLISTRVPTMDDFTRFLEQRAIIESSHLNQNQNSSQKCASNKNGNKSQSNSKQSQSCMKTTIDASSKKYSNSCPVCQEKHKPYACPTFLKLSPSERYNEIKKTSLCRNCLNGPHRTIDCKASNCQKCNEKHNTLLHFEKRSSNNQVNNSDVTATDSGIGDPSTSQSTQYQGFHAQITSQIVLGTAVVDISNSKGEFKPCRVLLDSGSQCNSISEKFASFLGLQKRSVNIKLHGAQNISSSVKYSTVVKIKSRYSNTKLELSCLIFKEISDLMPNLAIDKKWINIPDGIKLADPEFHKPAEINLLIGAEFFFQLLQTGQMCVKGQSAVFQETLLGWILTGSISNPICSNSSKISCNLIKFRDLPILWDIDTESNEKIQSADDVACEKHYKDNVSRLESGAYCVKLPFNEKRELLSNSRNTAFQRFYALERKFEKNPSLKDQYTECINGYLKLGHMSLVPPEEPLDHGYYLPHQAVVKTSSLTTKVRVVFDGSAKTTSGISLNDTLMVGPTVQDNLISILLRFRCFQYVLTADIEQMYRQIRVTNEDSLFQKILWRDSPKEPIKIYRLKTVTFGTSCAPFLATRTLSQLAEDESKNFPIASEVLKDDFYVDDLQTGRQTLEEARELRDDLIVLLNRGGFNLRKWTSNHPDLINDLANSNPEDFMSLDPTKSVKALGLHWHPSSDSIFYAVNFSSTKGLATKRSILSEASTIYDPYGLVAPVIVSAKILIQHLWKEKLSWDTPVSLDIQNFWNNYRNQLQCLNEIKFKRYILSPDHTELQIHGFADASEKAYGACLYFRVTNSQGQHHCALICAKSKVAPLKATTLPRLELCAANLLIKLYKSTVEAFQFQINKKFFWSDSTIVLNWINTPSYKLKTFVANRISEIQSNSQNHDWRHVPTQDNPADIISRGQAPLEFVNNRQWIQGPAWLSQDENCWPVFKLEKRDIPEVKTPSPISLIAKGETHGPSNIVRNHSKLRTCVNVMAYCLRWLSIVKRKKDSNKITGKISLDEYDAALEKLISLAQQESFPREFQALSKQENIHPKSSLVSLHPFFESNLIKVGGRLSQSDLSYSQKHPIVLPKNHALTKLIIRDEHISRMHAGTNATLYGVREKFWPIDGRNATRHTIKQCVQCFRAKTRELNYIMGNLPHNRLSSSRPFLNVGVDYCGPFFIKERRHRNLTKVKTYVCVFVCMATKAVHLELASDLTTEAFLNCLKRLFARRGLAHTISSDNATNFIGAKNELKELYKEIQTLEEGEEFKTFLVQKKISWYFIPPRTPHFGGLWEAAVKSFKKHFTSIAGNTLLTYEQLHTYVVEIEAILNSRPLTPLSSDPNDLLPLTPGHFLIGAPMTTFPHKDLRNVSANRLNCWEHAQQLRHHFWDRWSKEYLNELISRSKWKAASNQDDIKIGTLVVLKEDNLPPLSWRLGRISAIFPGQDGIIRTVNVQGSTGVYKRSLKSVYPLPIYNN